jgi:acetyl esterase
MRLLALASGAAVVGVDYALAPEHPFPRPLGESIAVIQHVAKHGASFGLDPSRIVLAGDSAGANLAVAAALALAKVRPNWLKGLVSLYGVLDCNLDSESYRRFPDGAAGLSRDNMGWFWRQYVPAGIDRADPRLSPARAGRADLARLPETLLIAAAYDVLLDDSRSFAARLAEAGVAHELAVYEGVCHGFSQYARLVTKARDSIDQAGAFCARVLR